MSLEGGLSIGAAALLYACRPVHLHKVYISLFFPLLFFITTFLCHRISMDGVLLCLAFQPLT